MYMYIIILHTGKYGRCRLEMYMSSTERTQTFIMILQISHPFNRTPTVEIALSNFLFCQVPF